MNRLKKCIHKKQIIEISFNLNLINFYERRLHHLQILKLIQHE